MFYGKWLWMDEILSIWDETNKCLLLTNNLKFEMFIYSIKMINRLEIIKKYIIKLNYYSIWMTKKPSIEFWILACKSKYVCTNNCSIGIFYSLWRSKVVTSHQYNLYVYVWWAVEEASNRNQGKSEKVFPMYEKQLSSRYTYLY